MSYPPLPSNGETQWGNKFRAWADALEGRKVEGNGMSLRRDTSVGERVLLDYPGGSTMLYGDTGWRSVPDLVVEDITVGSALLTRVNNTCSLTLILSNYNNQRIITDVLPNGFSPYSGMSGRAFATDHQGRQWRIVNSTVERLKATVEDGSIWMHFTYQTKEAWPTALPGTPA